MKTMYARWQKGEKTRDAKDRETEHGLAADPTQHFFLKPVRKPLGFCAVEQFRLRRKEIYGPDNYHAQEKQQLKHEYLIIRGFVQKRELLHLEPALIQPGDRQYGHGNER